MVTNQLKARLQDVRLLSVIMACVYAGGKMVDDIRTRRAKHRVALHQLPFKPKATISVRFRDLEPVNILTAFAENESFVKKKSDPERKAICSCVAFPSRGRHTSVPCARHSYPLSIYPNSDRCGNEICVRMTQAGQHMGLHRFSDRIISSSSILSRLRNEATSLMKPPIVSKDSAQELANTDFESWAKESFEIATKIAYRNDGRIEKPKAGI